MHKLRTIIAGVLGVAGLTAALAVPASAAPAASARVICALNVAVTHTSDSVTAKNNNSNPCGRFYWAWMIVKRNTGNQVQDDSHGVLSGFTTATDPAAIRNCGGGWKWSGTDGIVHQHLRYGSTTC